ncbi:hypothetical protein HDE77_002739 [Rhodanobacter sp. MP7CTX1]|nr:hypothetical protein [Rhodanobacter sp. MP7CTX1]
MRLMHNRLPNGHRDVSVLSAAPCVPLSAADAQRAFPSRPLLSASPTSRARMGRFFFPSRLNPHAQ